MWAPATIPCRRLKAFGSGGTIAWPKAATQGPINCNYSSHRWRPEVAIVGGGITGTVAATTLARLLRRAHNVVRPGAASAAKPTGALITARSWRRGRASMAFDHGCQFFQGGDAEFREKILNPWLKAGLAAEWRGRFAGAGDFFGVGRETVYVGVGGMHTVTAGAAQTLECNHANFVARRGVRVGAVARNGDRWALSGVGGEAAIHDSSLKSSDVEAARAAAALGEFDAVIVTDASAAQESWHRASAGLPESFLAMSKRVQDRVRVAMFTATVAFEEQSRSYDACPSRGVPRFAARTNSKPGFKPWRERWTPAVPGLGRRRGRTRADVDPATARLFHKAQDLVAPARALLVLAAAVGAIAAHASTRSAGPGGAPSRAAAMPSALGGDKHVGTRSTRLHGNCWPRGRGRRDGPRRRRGPRPHTPATSCSRGRPVSSPPRCREHAAAARARRLQVVAVGRQGPVRETKRPNTKAARRPPSSSFASPVVCFSSLSSSSGCFFLPVSGTAWP